jgi:hypothetical protein
MLRQRNTTKKGICAYHKAFKCCEYQSRRITGDISSFSNKAYLFVALQRQIPFIDGALNGGVNLSRGSITY